VSEHTSIEWADSSCNAMMGCNGCELWNRATGVAYCYAGLMTDRYGGQAGWPASFDHPMMFTGRIEKAATWKDLTGKSRLKKPWLDGMPRMIFLNDMGDTFTEALPNDWLAPYLPVMERTPHVWLLLTKRGEALRQFAEAHPLPANVWPGVSVTTNRSLPRLDSLRKIRSGGPKWVSVEPLIEEVTLPADAISWLNWVVVGGESGTFARPCDVDWIRSIVDVCRANAVACFVKQLGSKPIGAGVLPVNEKFKGNDEADFPFDLRGQRNFPDPDLYRAPHVPTS
jgi:protein gp37